MKSLGLLLLCLSVGVLSKRVPWWAIKLAQEQGPNACVVEEIPGTGKKLWTECKYWTPREICGKKTIVRYECCEGFEQLEGQQGCTGVLPLGNVVDTARKLGATMFVDFLEDAKLTDQLTKEGAYTLLVPTNKALEEAPLEVVSQLELYSRDPRNPLLLYHVAEGRVTTDNINKDLMVDSRNGASKLRFNAYATGVVTVNCVPIIRKDQQASNGVVHLIDKVLNPSIYTGKSIVNTIAEDGRFTEFSKALDANGYNHELSDYPFTFFSPADEAFQSIPAERLEKIMSDRSASKALLENHMIPHPICPSAIHKEAKMRSMSKEKLTFNCDEQGEYVEDITVGEEFLLATDGIIHVINDVIMPDRARSLAELLESHQLWTFLSLVQQAGLYETFSRYGDYTVFVPSEEAFQAMGEARLQQLREDVDSLRRFIMYHCTQGRIKTSLMTDNQAVISLDEKNSLRLQVYRNGIGVENAEILKSDIEGQNGIVHVISKVLEAPTKSAGELLRSLGSHNMFLTMMEKATNQVMSEVGQEEQRAYTFLAPSDHAFERLGQETLDLIMEDEAYASELVKNHIVNRIICSNSFKPELQYKAATKSGELHIIKREEQLQINGANVETADLMTTNGIVYLIDQVLVPQLSSQTTTYRNITTTTSFGGDGVTVVNKTITKTVHRYESSGGGHTSSSSTIVVSQPHHVDEGSFYEYEYPVEVDLEEEDQHTSEEDIQ